MTPMQLSEHFSLDEMVFSQTAARKGIANEVIPGGAICANLLRLCSMVLEPIRAHFGPVIVTSGYRSRELNEAVGGDPASQHVLGLAADIRVPHVTPLDLAAWIVSSGLPFDQVIHEFGRWVHVSAPAPEILPRRMGLTSYRRRAGGVDYMLGIRSLDALTAPGAA